MQAGSHSCHPLPTLPRSRKPVPWFSASPEGSRAWGPVRDSLGPWSGLWWGRQEATHFVRLVHKQQMGPAACEQCGGQHWAAEGCSHSKSQTSCAACDPKTLSTYSPQPLGYRCKLQPNPPGPKINFLWVGFPMQSRGKAHEGQAQPRPSREGLDCPSATRSGKWASQLEGGFSGTHLCYVPSPAIAKTLPLLSPTKRPRRGKALMGVGGEDAELRVKSFLCS